MMSRAPIYATNASLNPESSSEQSTVIRPPIRQAYNSQESYEEAKLQGKMYADRNKIV